MFKNIKSALIYYYLYKFKNRFLTIFAIAIFTIFLHIIYIDIVEYLTLRNKLSYLDTILPLKWIVTIFNISLIIYLFFSIFKTKQEIKIEQKSDTIEQNETKFSKREESFLNKKLQSKADLIINKKG